MRILDLRNLFDIKGYSIALAVLEAAKLHPEREQRLLETLEAWQEEKLRRWTHPSRYPAAFDRHEL